MQTTEVSQHSDWTVPGHPRNWRVERIHIFLLLGIGLALINAANVLFVHRAEDVITYATAGCMFAFAGASQFVSRPVGTSWGLNVRYRLWGIALLLRSIGLMWGVAELSHLAHIPFLATQICFVGMDTFCYIALVNPPVESAGRRSWILSSLTALVVGGLILILQVHTDGTRANARLILIVAVQGVFAGAAFLSRLASSSLIERRLTTRMAVFFTASFCVALLSNSASVWPWLPWYNFANAFYPLDSLVLLAFCVRQLSQPETFPAHTRVLPTSTPLFMTVALLLVCVPLLHWHVTISIVLIIAALTLFAVRVALLQNHLDHERKALPHSTHALRTLANTDSLTGIANRRCFLEALEHELQRTRDHQASFVLALFDLDNLKQINDNQGHPAGDTCLKDFADVVSRSVAPPFDHFARLGGDEFALLLADVDTTDASLLIADIRSALAATQVRFSCGLCPCHPHEISTATDLIAEADANLYQAKRKRALERRA